jgi:UDP-glucuronate 4-epimerase
MNELQLSAYRDLFGIGVTALRYFTVYGPRQRPDMAIAKFVDAIARDRPITLFGDGSSRRDYTFIDDIVAGTVAAIERVRPADYEIYNLGGTHTISLAELVAICERTVGKPARIDRLPDQPGDVPITYANIDRARAALGYEPTTRPDDGIARYWQWLQRHGRPMP